MLKIKDTILQKTVAGMQQEGVPYTGRYTDVLVDITCRGTLHHFLSFFVFVFVLIF